MLFGRAGVVVDLLDIGSRVMDANAGLRWNIMTIPGFVSRNEIGIWTAAR